MKTSFYVPDDLAAKAKKHGISVTEVARKALQQAVRDAELLPTGEQLAAALIALGWTPPDQPVLVDLSGTVLNDAQVAHLAGFDKSYYEIREIKDEAGGE